MSAQQLAEMARQVRGDTLRLLAAAPEASLLFAPPGTSNHILWHAGHALAANKVVVNGSGVAVGEVDRALSIGAAARNDG